MPSPAARWRAQVHARLGETARLRERAGFPRELWSAPRARRYARRVPLAPRSDPLLERLLEEDGARTFLDLGAGTGRLAIPLARAGRQVIAVEPSAGMRAALAREAGPDPRIRVVPSAWPAPGLSADVAFSSHVLFLVEDADGFLRAMTAASGRRCFLVLAALHSDAITDPLWRHFHRTPRQPSPTYLDAVAILRGQGARPRVTVLPPPRPPRYPSIAAAVPDYRENLALGDDPATLRELRRVLRAWLVHDDGAFEPPAAARPALIDWAPDQPV